MVAKAKFLHICLCLLAICSFVAVLPAVAQLAAQGYGQTQNNAEDVLKQPLDDLNLMQEDIPPLLLQAKADPYARPAKLECSVVDAEVNALDHILGPDFDAAIAGAESLATTVSDATFDLARGAVSGFIPFRGLLRRVTGADRRARNINNAVLSALARRSYLKGVGEQLGCDYPAAPLRVLFDEDPGE